MKKLMFVRLAIPAAAMLPVLAFAQGGGPAAPSLASLTPDFTTVNTAILAIAVVVAGVIVTFKGVKWGYRALKGG